MIKLRPHIMPRWSALPLVRSYGLGFRRRWCLANLTPDSPPPSSSLGHRGIHTASVSATLSASTPTDSPSSVSSSSSSSSSPSPSPSSSWLALTASGFSCPRVSCCIRAPSIGARGRNDGGVDLDIVGSTHQLLDGWSERTCELLDDWLGESESEMRDVKVTNATTTTKTACVDEPVVHIYQTDDNTKTAQTAKGWKLEWSHMLDADHANGEISMEFLKALSQISFKSKLDAIEFAKLQGWGYDLI